MGCSTSQCILCLKAAWDCGGEVQIPAHHLLAVCFMQSLLASLSLSFLTCKKLRTLSCVNTHEMLAYYYYCE